MRRLIAITTSPRLQVWIAGLSLVAWMILSPVTMTTGLRNAIWWITAASLFANVATCFGWWVTALVQLRTQRIEAASIGRKLDHVIEHHPDIPPYPPQ